LPVRAIMYATGLPGRVEPLERKTSMQRNADSDKPGPEKSAGHHDSPADPRSQKLLVVAIGASAGGLEALERFFKAMPPDSNMAFVVIQHLSPDFKSLMDELLAR